MSEQPDIDARIAALLADPQPARPDSAFADRIVALAAYDLSTRKSRRRSLIQVGREALGLAAVLASFAILARAGPLSAGLGDAIGFGSPAMAGLAMLLMWALVATKGQAAASR